MSMPNCPCCQSKLKSVIRINEGQSEYFLWCANPRCPVKASEEGAEGSTVKEALKKLTKTIDKEIDGNEPEA